MDYGLRSTSYLPFISYNLPTDFDRLRLNYQIQICKSETQNAKIFFSIDHPHTPKLLGQARRCDVASLILPSWRRDDEPSHLPVCPGSRAVECGLCNALRASRRRALR